MKKIPTPTEAKFPLGAAVRKKRGGAWRGYVRGYYATSLTEMGCNVESHYEPGSVQVYPESALELWDSPLLEKAPAYPTVMSLLRKQIETQVAGGMSKPRREQVLVALRTELGEFLQELKPLWAWWSKPGAALAVNKARVLSEGVDVLAFALLLLALPYDWDDLKLKDSLNVAPRAALPHSYHHLSDAQLFALLCDTVPSVDSINDERSALELIVLVYVVLAECGSTEPEVAEAYWEKCAENLARWEAA